MATSQKFIVVTGIPEIDRKLKKLPGVIQKKVLRSAMRKGMKLVATETRRQVPVRTGLTRASVKTRAVKKRSRNQVEIEVKIGGDPGLYRTGADGKTVFYPAIVEYRDDAFMRRSFQAAGEPARNVTIALIRAGVEEEAKRL